MTLRGVPRSSRILESVPTPCHLPILPRMLHKVIVEDSFIRLPLEEGADLPVYRRVTLAIDGVMSGAVANRYESESDKRESGKAFHYATSFRVMRFLAVRRHSRHHSWLSTYIRQGSPQARQIEG